MRIIYLFLIIFFPFEDAYSQKKINHLKLQEDFDYAVSQLKSMHQGYAYYLDETTTDTAVFKLRNKIEAPMTKLEFYQIIRKLIGLMNEGHGSVDLPKWTMIKIGITKFFLPITVRYLNKELIVTQNFGENIEGLSKGVKLIAINGEPITQIMEKLLPLIATDGFNETSRFQWIGSVNLSLLYRLVYGKQTAFELEVIEPNHNKSKVVNIPAIRFKQFKRKNAKFKSKSFNYKKFTFQSINDSIAYLSIPGFGNDNLDYEAFYKKQFRRIDSLKIKHLIIDIQANGGGEEGNENLLFSYLSEERIQKYKRVTMPPRLYQKNKNSKGYLFDKWALKGAIAERGAFTLYSDYYSELGYSIPNKEDIYQGKLYVLISGITFSGGAEFASMIKMTNRASFIGEETGGAYEGNVSGYLETIKLPKTKIRIDIPKVHFQINVEPAERGRGIMPDYEVPETWEDYLKGGNAKLDFTKKLIMN